MTNDEKYRQLFIATFGVTGEALPGLAYQGVDAWDSVGHMELIAGLEEMFNIMMETDDIIRFNSFTIGYEILRKYDVRV